MKNFPLAGKLTEWKPPGMLQPFVGLHFPLAGKLTEWKLERADAVGGVSVVLPTRWETN